MSNNKEIGIDQAAEVFKALSNPNRLKILKRLMSCCPPGTRTILDMKDLGEVPLTACVGELAGELDIVASTVSHHIKELRRAGLINTQRNGQRIECWLDPKMLESLKLFFT